MNSSTAEGKGFIRGSAGRVDTASNESCAEGWIGWVPLAVLTPLAIALRSMVRPWIFMWLVVAAIFAGCKWQTWWGARAAQHTRNWGRTAAYLLLWPGMDAQEFFEAGVRKRAAQLPEWLAALAKTLTGVGMPN